MPVATQPRDAPGGAGAGMTEYLALLEAGLLAARGAAVTGVS